MKCKHCGWEIDNPEIFNIHESNCLNEQMQNGLIVASSSEENTGDNSVNNENIDYSNMTLDQLKTICKEKGLEGYSNFNKDDLVKFIQENLKK